VIAALTLAVLAGAADAPMVEGVAIEADRVVVEGRVAHGEGHVVVAVGDDVVRGAAIDVDLDAGTAVVTDGSWTRPDGAILAFSRAEITVPTHAIAVTDGVYTDGSLRVEGRSLAFDADGVLVGQRVRVTLCACDGVEPWAVGARRVEVEPGAVVRFRGAVVRILDVPVLPVPFGEVPLARRSGLLPPQLGSGDDGLRVAMPLYIAPERWFDLTFTPEVRTARSARLIGEGRYATRHGGGVGTAVGGWDWQTSTWRGGLDWRSGLAIPWGIAANEGRFTTDPRVAADYGDSFLARQQPWGEGRNLLGAGPLELATDVLQSPAAVWQQLAMTAQRPTTALGSGFLASAAVTAGVAAVQPAGLPIEEPVEHIALFADISRPTWVGPILVVPSVVADAEIASGDLPNPRPRDVHAVVEARLPLWHAGAALDTVAPLVRVQQVLVDLTEPLAPAAPDATPQVAPGILWTRAGALHAVGTATVSDHAELAFEADGDGFGAWAQGRTAAWDADGAEPIALASAGVSVDPGPVHADASWIRADGALLRQPVAGEVHDLEQVRGTVAWTLPGPVSVFRLSVGIAADLEGKAWLSRSVGLRYTHPTGCVAIGAVARVEPDRELPDVAVTIDVFPR
jgi:hypothetical protein